MGMTKISCQYYRCDKVRKSEGKPYCPRHLKMVKKLDRIVRNSNRKRVCLYPKCGTVLNRLNSNYFCYIHYRKVLLEMDGLNPDKMKGEELDVSQVNQDKVEKVLHFKKRRVANET